MNKSELIAYNILEGEDWNPKRIRPERNTFESGMPDFECSNNRYVEVKRWKGGIGLNQLSRWEKLQKQGKGDLV